jgi:hypothetical protein
LAILAMMVDIWAAGVEMIHASMWNICLVFNMTVLIILIGLWGSLQIEWVQYELETTCLTFEKLLFTLLPLCSSVIITWAISCFEDATNISFYFCATFYVNFLLFVVPAPSSFLKFTCESPVLAFPNKI